MEALPDVVVHLTAKYLEGQELACWCATSRNWRDRLNDNVLWRHRCDPLTAEYLKNTECQVEPFFTSPEVADSGLSAICEWRLCFMRQVHLWNNWRLDRHTERFLPARTAFSPQFKRTESALFYKNDFLITNNENTIEVWNVRQAPVPVCLEPLLSTQDVKLFKLCGDKIVVVQHFLVQVFQISIMTGKLIFLHSFIYHGTKKNTEKIYGDEARLNDIFNSPQAQVLLVDHIFVAMFNSSPKTLHVWNVETGEKVREEQREEMTFLHFYRHSRPKEPYLTVTAKDEKKRFYIMIYCLDDFHPVFTSPKYHSLPYALVFKDFVLIHVFDTNIDIYRFKTGQLIQQVDLQDQLLTNLYSVGNSVIFQSGSRTLMKFNPCTEQVEELPELTSSTNEAMVLNSQIYLNEEYGFFWLNEYSYLVQLKPNRVKALRRLQFFMFGQMDMEVGEGGVFSCINQTFTKVVINSIKRSEFERVRPLISMRDNIPRRMKLLTFW